MVVNLQSLTFGAVDDSREDVVDASVSATETAKFDDGISAPGMLGSDKLGAGTEERLAIDWVESKEVV